MIGWSRDHGTKTKYPGSEHRGSDGTIPKSLRQPEVVETPIFWYFQGVLGE